MVIATCPVRKGVDDLGRLAAFLWTRQGTGCGQPLARLDRELADLREWLAESCGLPEVREACPLRWERLTVQRESLGTNASSAPIDP